MAVMDALVTGVLLGQRLSPQCPGLVWRCSLRYDLHLSGTSTTAVRRGIFVVPEGMVGRCTRRPKAGGLSELGVGR